MLAVKGIKRRAKSLAQMRGMEEFQRKTWKF
jgi:hypothetical protein